MTIITASCQRKLASSQTTIQSKNMAAVNPPHFELESYVDLYKKAKRDFAKLDELVNSDDLFNFLCTINHVWDWANEELKVAGVKIPNNGSDKREQVVECLNIVRQLCNRAKHFEKKQSHLDTFVERGYGVGRYGLGPYGIGEPSYTVMVDGQKISVLQICKDALAIWGNFISNTIAMSCND